MRPAAAPSLTALALAALALTACSSPEPAPAQDPPTAPARAVVTQEHEPYTSTYQVEVAGEVVGYLVTYDTVPIHALDLVERTLPDGTHRIQDTAFQDVGFISPAGDVRQYVDGDAPRSLGVREDLREGLSLFYGERKPVKLSRLELGGPAKVD